MTRKSKQGWSKEDLARLSLTGTPIGVASLPGRADKRIVPVPVPTIEFLNPDTGREYKSSDGTMQAKPDWSWRNLFGSPPPGNFKTQGTTIRQASAMSDYSTYQAKSTFTNYMDIRIADRREGPTVTKPEPLVFRFLINPYAINVSRNTIDAQSMARAGWQVGFWGDDTVEIRLEGVTAGQYFTLGLTNNFNEHTASYRNFMEFVSLFENNGYWFEGEDIDNSTLANDALRRRIRFHSDVELRVGNFCWSGCFTDLEFTEDADKPYQISFSATFMAWKERFVDASPWRDSIHNDVYRGHAYEATRSLILAAAKEREDKAKAEAAARKAEADAGANLAAAGITQADILALGKGPLSNQAAQAAMLQATTIPTTPNFGSASLANMYAPPAKK
jgi:hypothetical protein